MKKKGNKSALYVLQELILPHLSDDPEIPRAERGRKELGTSENFCELRHYQFVNSARKGLDGDKAANCAGRRGIRAQEV